MLFKYIVKNTAWAHGKTATFMPKPLFGDNGSGHALPPVAVEGRRAAVLRRDSATPACPTPPAGTSAACCKHAPSLLAFTNPTVNSYRRLVPGFEAPVNLVYSQRNRSACIRIPITGTNPKAKRIEFRVPDPSSNPYLAFSAMLMAGLDGIKNKIEPPAADRQGPLRAAAGGGRRRSRRCPARWTRCSTRSRPTTSSCWPAACSPPDLIETWIDYKRDQRDRPVRLRPHPYEFELYYDI